MQNQVFPFLFLSELNNKVSEKICLQSYIHFNKGYISYRYNTRFLYSRTMVTGPPEHGIQADVVFVIEGTAVNGAYLNDLKTNYVIPTLE